MQKTHLRNILHSSPIFRKFAATKDCLKIVSRVNNFNPAFNSKLTQTNREPCPEKYLHQEENFLRSAPFDLMFRLEKVG